MGEVPVAATGLLRTFTDAGYIATSDFHVARTLLSWQRHVPQEVTLAVALAVRQLRTGSVCLDLNKAASLAPIDEGDDGEIAVAPVVWPPLGPWLEALRACPTIAPPDASASVLRLDGHRLYLERCYRDEGRLAEALAARRHISAESVPTSALALATAPDAYGFIPDDDQRRAIEMALTYRSLIITGGPGTGKTNTVARIIDGLAAAKGRLSIALAAPTGKAAQELTGRVAQLSTVGDSIRPLFYGNLTLHKLLGTRPGTEMRTYTRTTPLPYHVVIVDEVSMVPLNMMSWLFEALSQDARVILLGDPSQLSSVQEGAVLARMASHELLPVARLGHNHRSNQEINGVAEAIELGNASLALTRIDASSSVQLINWDPHQPLLTDPGLQDRIRTTAHAMFVAAQAGDALGGLQAMSTHRILCAHREGHYGVGHWASTVRSWLAHHLPEYRSDQARWVGQPLLITRNSHQLRNGQTAIIIRTTSGLKAAVFLGDTVELLEPDALTDVADLHAMTIHKSQGSQFQAVTIVLPPLDSPLLTRELIYTAITRAKHNVYLYGSPEQLQAAIETPMRRDDGLAERTQAIRAQQ